MNWFLPVLTGVFAAMSLVVSSTTMRSAMPTELALLETGLATPVTAQAKAAAYLTNGKLVVYLNRDGGMYYANAYINDARTNTSSVPTQTSYIAPWNVDDDTWHKLGACVSQRFAPFAVEFTDVEPEGDTPHIEAVIGGRPQDLGMPVGHGGVAPFAWDCSVIANAIVFSFAEVYTHDDGVNLEALCDTTAQEIAHAIGADHSFNAPDVMSYLRYDEARSFVDAEVQCGEYAGRSCGIGGNVCSATQNTYKLLADRIGLASNPRAEAGQLDDEPNASGCSASATRAGSVDGGGASATLALAALCGAMMRRTRKPVPRQS